jgi:AcrR family transcriptional regulator
MNKTTRGRLVQAARRIFAEKGFDAASVREITAAAAANLGAVNYHFGSKQGLYEAVLDAAIEPLARRLGLGVPSSEPGAAAVGTAVDRIDRIVAALFEHLAANPDLQLLVLQHAVTRRALPEPLRGRLGLLVGRLAEEIRAGQREGSIARGDALLTALSVLAQPMYFGLVSRLAPERLRTDDGAAPDAATISAHARRFTRAALAGGREGADG